ncbi:hypothetical protein FGB62_87g053 [Gracilaria domingensis]|nr:hypothetical protein FGB62_87g053 [Gracilaria domingensis]
MAAGRTRAAHETKRCESGIASIYICLVRAIRCMRGGSYRVMFRYSRKCVENISDELTDESRARAATRAKARRNMIFSAWGREADRFNRRLHDVVVMIRCAHAKPPCNCGRAEDDGASTPPVRVLTEGVE